MEAPGVMGRGHTPPLPLDPRHPPARPARFTYIDAGVMLPALNCPGNDRRSLAQECFRMASDRWYLELMTLPVASARLTTGLVASAVSLAMLGSGCTKDPGSEEGGDGISASGGVDSMGDGDGERGSNTSA